MPEWMLSALAAAAASGLVNFGMFKVKLDWLKENHDILRQRVDSCQLNQLRRASDVVQCDDVIHRHQ